MRSGSSCPNNYAVPCGVFGFASVQTDCVWSEMVQGKKDLKDVLRTQLLKQDEVRLVAVEQTLVIRCGLFAEWCKRVDLRATWQK